MDAESDSEEEDILLTIAILLLEEDADEEDGRGDHSGGPSNLRRLEERDLDCVSAGAVPPAEAGLTPTFVVVRAVTTAAHNPEAFRRRYRITVVMFQYLADVIKEDVCSPYYPGTYATKPVEDQLAVFLDHLAFGGQLLPLSDSYGMAESTVKKSIARVSKALIKHFHTAVRPPTADEVTAWDEYNFRKFHLRGAVAAMDSTHIPLANVEIGVKTAYLNHKEGSQAFICHTVVSPSGRVLHLKIGDVGSSGDSRVWGLCDLGIALMTALADGSRAWLLYMMFILCDQAYALRVYQQKVVNDDVAAAEPTGKIRYYNKQQRKGRRIVERVYGIIKNMWQSLKMRTMFHRDQKIRDCYVAFILHNLKLEARDTFDWGYAEPDEESPVLAADTDVEGKLNGDIFRNNLINQMWIDRTERKAAAAQVA